MVGGAEKGKRKMRGRVFWMEEEKRDGGRDSVEF